MRSWMIACVLGLVLPGLLPEPVGPAWYAVLAFLFLLSQQFRRFRLLAAFCLGLGWSAGYAWLVATSLLPTAMTGEIAAICGEVAEIPQQRPEFTRFLLRPEAESASWVPGVPPAGLLSLNWYRAPELRAGDTVCVQARLRAPRGLLNAGGFDSERWLLARGIRATGTVAGGQVTGHAEHPLDALRVRLKDRILGAHGSEVAKGLLIALTLGDRSGIDSELRERLAATGTAHLLAISGLHVGMVAAVLGLLARRPLAWLFPRRQPAVPRLALMTGLAGATVYAALTGFGLPARRALIMLACAALPWLWGRPVAISTALLLALLLILLWEPLAWLDGGLWLSFVAVAALAAGFAGRGGSGSLRQIWRAQWIVFLGLLPVLGLAGLPVNLFAPLVNLLAIPLVGLLVLPCGLLGLLLAPVTALPLDLALWLLDWLAWLLLQVAQGSAWALLPGSSPAVLLLAGLGAALLLAPAAVPARRLFGLLAMIPLLLPAASDLADGQLRLHALDVGHGTAVLVETRGYRLLYDTGGGDPQGWNVGRAVLVPFLRRRGIRGLDELILSHADNDHVGGYRGLVQRVPVGLVTSNVRLPMRGIPRRPCRAGMRWQRNGVQFRLLHPQVAQGQGNDQSCVLRIQTGAHVILLAGDIERNAEHQLLATAGGDLAASLLLAPHHGSRTSSSPAFVRAVDPAVVVYSTGWPGRFRHPHAEVEARYLRSGARGWQTGKSGTLSFLVDPGRPLSPPSRARSQRYYWRAPDPSVDDRSAVIELRRLAHWTRLLGKE